MDPHALSDSDFLAGFEACELPPVAFNHLGHLRVAWICLRKYPTDEAERRVCTGIERFAVRLGVPGKYNQTLTMALLRLMAHGGAADQARSFSAFLAGNPELLEDAKGVLARYYSPGCLESVEAKRSFSSPDRAPLPR